MSGQDMFKAIYFYFSYKERFYKNESLLKNSTELLLRRGAKLRCPNQISRSSKFPKCENLSSCSNRCHRIRAINRFNLATAARSLKTIIC